MRSYLSIRCLFNTNKEALQCEVQDDHLTLENGVGRSYLPSAHLQNFRFGKTLLKWKHFAIDGKQRSVPTNSPESFFLNTLNIVFHRPHIPLLPTAESEEKRLQFLSPFVSQQDALILKPQWRQTWDNPSSINNKLLTGNHSKIRAQVFAIKPLDRRYLRSIWRRHCCHWWLILRLNTRTNIFNATYRMHRRPVKMLE